MTLELITPEWTKARQDRIGACQYWLDKCGCELFDLLRDESFREHASDAIAGFCALQRVLNALSEDSAS
jgi:hypothetical protein